MSLIPLVELFADTPEFKKFTKSLVTFPSVDLHVSNNSDLLLKADIPGVPRDSLNVKVDQNLLTISGERSRDINENDVKRSFYERQTGKFSRVIKLPFSPNPENIKAKYIDGVLTLYIKYESKDVKKIEINYE